MSGRFIRRRALAALCLRQIFLGGHPCVFFEKMAEIGGVLEADALRDLEYLQISLVQKLAGILDLLSGDRFHDRPPGLLTEEAAEIAGADVHGSRQFAQRQRLAEMQVHVVLHVRQKIAALRREQREILTDRAHKLLLVTAINAYLKGLEGDVLDKTADNRCFVSLSGQRSYLESRGTDTSDMKDTDILKANTGSQVFLEAKLTFCDAMEDLALVISM